jgi:hypothetical protein
VTIVSRLWAWLCAALLGVIAVLGGLLWWRKREDVHVAHADAARARESAEARKQEAEETAAIRVAAVDVEAERRIREAAHGGSAALRDAIANKR